jgi:predicted DNA-binding protein YlxM (UPF0122 family)
LDAIKDDVSYDEISRRFSITKAYISEIKRNRKYIEDFVNNGGNLQMKRTKLLGSGAEIDKRVYDWYVKARLENVKVSGKMLKAAALRAADEIHENSFRGGNGWLDCFQKRHNIKLVAGGNVEPSPIPAAAASSSSSTSALRRHPGTRYHHSGLPHQMHIPASETVLGDQSVVASMEEVERKFNLFKSSLILRNDPKLLKRTNTIMKDLEGVITCFKDSKDNPKPAPEASVHPQPQHPNSLSDNGLTSGEGGAFQEMRADMANMHADAHAAIAMNPVHELGAQRMV